MLVALPSAIAFGVTIYSPLGRSYAAFGALAGILGATSLGLIAPALGGANRLISAPSAPAAAVLSAFAIELLHDGTPPKMALVILAAIGLLAGLLQVVFGAVGLGRLIKYIPYPVVSGYLSGVGMYIIASQTPKLLGVPKDMHFWDALASPEVWQWQGMVVGGATAAVMLLAPRLTRKVPATVLALVGGIAAYFVVAWFEPALRSLSGNPFVIGSLAGDGGGFAEAIAGRWRAVGGIDLDRLEIVATSALTLAVLLSIDTLKTCVVLDTLTRSRHNSNRELIGQGVGNIVSAVAGGIPGSGTMGATLVNVSSGATSRRSGLIEGLLSLLALLAFGGLIAWVPVASLAAILIVIGARMIDRHSLSFLKSRTTALDFAIIAVVVVVALTVSLIAASGAGVALAVLLFLREQIGGNIVRHKTYGNATFSKQIRLHDEMAILEREGHQAVILELQGSLFFGTADQLYRVLEPEIERRRYIILDMRRVQSVDVTAAHALEQIEDRLAERGGFLIFSQLPSRVPSGLDMQRYFNQVGLVRNQRAARIFGELDEAVQWIEDRILAEASVAREEETLLELPDIELLQGRKPDTLADLDACLEKRAVRAGVRIFAKGDAGDELFLIRRGEVRLMLPIHPGLSHHLGTVGRGGFFGEMAFLDGAPRSADAIAFTDTDLYVLSRGTFDKLADGHKRAALKLMEGIASALASRLRYANAEMRALED